MTNCGVASLQHFRISKITSLDYRMSFGKLTIKIRKISLSGMKTHPDVVRLNSE